MTSPSTPPDGHLLSLTMEMAEQLQIGLVALGSSGALRAINDTGAALLSGQEPAADSAVATLVREAVTAGRALFRRLNAQEAFVALPGRAREDGERIVALLPTRALELAYIGQMDRLAHVAAARAGHHDADRARARVAEDHPLLATLTRREREITSLLTEGWRVRQIAERLELSEHTVRNHLKSIFRKTETHGQTELLDRLMANPSERNPETAQGVTAS